MASILVTATRTVRPGIKKRTLSEHVHMGSVSLTITLIIFTSLVSLAYLLYANQTATKGYVFKTLEQQRTALILEGQKWDMKIATAKSLDRLKENPLVADMREHKDDPLFIRGDTAVASKNK
jgi:hypothetical protein